MAITPEQEQQRAQNLEQSKATGKQAGQNVGKNIGANTGAQAGKLAGQAGGAAAGGAAGAGIGGIGGAIKGGIQGAAAGGIGAIPGALSGGAKGAGKGAQKGANLGKNIGGRVGEFAGKQAGKQMGKYAGGKIGEKGGGTLGSLANKTGFGKEGIGGAAKSWGKDAFKNAQQALSNKSHELDLGKKFVGGDFKGAEQAMRKAVGQRTGQVLGSAIGVPPTVAGMFGEKLLGSRSGKYLFWSLVALMLVNWMLLLLLILLPIIFIIMAAAAVVLIVIFGGPFAICAAAQQVIETLRIFMQGVIQGLVGTVPNFSSLLPIGVSQLAYVATTTLNGAVNTALNNVLNNMTSFAYAAPGQGALTAQAALAQVQGFTIQLQNLISTSTIPASISWTINIPNPLDPLGVIPGIPDFITQTITLPGVRNFPVVQAFIGLVQSYINLINNQILNVQGAVDAAAQLASICQPPTPPPTP